jgi:hypothetical protein
VFACGVISPGVPVAGKMSVVVHSSPGEGARGGGLGIPTGSLDGKSKHAQPSPARFPVSLFSSQSHQFTALLDSHSFINEWVIGSTESDEVGRYSEPVAEAEGGVSRDPGFLLECKMGGGWSAHPPASFSVPCTWSPHGSRPEIGANQGVARKADSLQRLDDLETTHLLFNSKNALRSTPDVPDENAAKRPTVSLSRHTSCNTGDRLGEPSQWLLCYPVCLKAALLIRQRQTVTLSHCPRA